MLHRRTSRLLALSVIASIFGGGADAAPWEPERPATVLLVTSAELAPAWQHWAEWKTRLGKSTKIVTVAEIRATAAEGSIQEAIRLVVRDHIENHGTRWVVLGGDCLPNGEGLVPGGPLTVHSQERKGIPTDLIYLSPTDWDADGDGIHGEWKEDRDAITYPDGSVGLGRIPVRTAEDVAAFTAKVIAYECSYPEDGFAERMVYTCTDSPAYPKVRKSWDGYVSKVWKGGAVERFFSQETPWDEEGEPGSYPLSPENLVSLLNEKRVGKMHVHGHGHLPAWVLETGRFSFDHVGELTNDGAYPLLTTVSCNTGEFDSKKDPSIIEALIRRPLGGSVAVVAPIRTGKPHFAKRSDFRLMVSEGKLDGTTWTMTQYWSEGLGENATTGESLMRAKAKMADMAREAASYHLCICELNLLGDPTLDMRAQNPRQAKVEWPSRLPLGAQTVAVASDAPGATICAWKAGEAYASVQTDENGTAKLELRLDTPGELKLAISGPSLNATTHTVAVGEAGGR